MFLTVDSKSAVNGKKMYRGRKENSTKGGIGVNREKYTQGVVGLKLKIHQKRKKKSP